MDKVEEANLAEFRTRTDVNSQIVNGIVDEMVATVSTELDNYIAFIRDLLNDKDNPPTDIELDDFTLNLPTLIYFTGDAQESLGVREDVAKAIKAELYNDAYASANGKIADKKLAADEAVQVQYLALIAYQRAYKRVKFKVDAANELLQSVKKVITRRIAEYETTRVDTGRVGGR